jgi:hypothetical protein
LGHQAGDGGQRANTKATGKFTQRARTFDAGEGFFGGQTPVASASAGREFRSGRTNRGYHRGLRDALADGSYHRARGSGGEAGNAGPRDQHTRRFTDASPNVLTHAFRPLTGLRHHRRANGAAKPS